MRLVESRCGSLRSLGRESYSLILPSLNKDDRNYSSIPGPEHEKKEVVDVFTKKLQLKTERELEELVAGQKSRPFAENEDRGERNKSDSREIGGPKGPEPTRYGDWERAGRCSDF